MCRPHLLGFDRALLNMCATVEHLPACDVMQRKSITDNVDVNPASNGISRLTGTSSDVTVSRSCRHVVVQCGRLPPALDVIALKSTE